MRSLILRENYFLHPRLQNMVQCGAVRTSSSVQGSSKHAVGFGRVFQKQVESFGSWFSYGFQHLYWYCNINRMIIKAKSGLRIGGG